jgi:cytochrome c oxidase assembly protein subunit 15|tara:strand:+ start:370 stop:1308 length:939 start_codon:yes stop_codon:yes gene_type:complete
MIIVGGLTRLTDSGLSITEWELFKGFLPPLSQNDWLNYFELYKNIPEYTEQNYNMSLSEFKIIFWWEWAHRFLGRLIGIVFLIPLIYLFFKHDFNFVKKYVLIFLLICFQGFLGWYMVSSGLVDRVDVSHYRLSIHLFVAFVILSLVIWEFLLNINLKKIKINFKTYLPEIFLFLLFIQLILGAFVSGMDAGKIYNNWPLMGQNYYPDDSYFSDLFKLNAFDNPSIVQFIHRNMAYVILIFYLFVVFKFSKIKVKYINNIIYIIGIILFLQIFLGILTLLSGANIFYSSLHQINTIFLFSSSIYFIFRTKQN